MPSSILTLLDYVEKTTAELYSEIRKRSTRKTETELEKLIAFLDCQKSQLPKEFIKKHFADMTLTE